MNRLNLTASFVSISMDVKEIKRIKIQEAILLYNICDIFNPLVYKIDDLWFNELFNIHTK